jgi:NAD(P)-dependent dehydrogenase (short-subunit alcohol dehydrogenase family)
MAHRGAEPQLVNGRVCLLTGAGGQLGTAFCRRFADRYAIAAVHRGGPPAVATQHQHWIDPLRPDDLLDDNLHPVFGIAADLSQPGAIGQAVELTLARFGHIDLVVNAIGCRVWAPLVDSERVLDSAADQLEINALVPVRVAVELARRCWRTRDAENRAASRHVLNVSSTAGLYVYAGLGQSAYSASKAALNFFTLHLAEEFAQFGVRVNAVAPDSFPGRISLSAVLDGIERLDRGDVTGRILSVETDGEHWQ